LEPYISHCASRRECWKGHGGTESVRRSIAYADRHPYAGPLRIFELTDTPVGAMYVEVPEEDWAAEFVL
jgi:hypothetical protein